MIERRRYPRLAIDLPVILRHGGRLIPATALNMSCGGMFIRADQGDISSELPVEVIFDLDKDKKDIFLMGRIRHTQNLQGLVGIGVQFSDLFTSSYKAIQDYLNRHLS